MKTRWASWGTPQGKLMLLESLGLGDLALAESLAPDDRLAGNRLPNVLTEFEEGFGH
jgi:hypothetical protein